MAALIVGVLGYKLYASNTENICNIQRIVNECYADKSLLFGPITPDSLDELETGYYRQLQTTLARFERLEKAAEISSLSKEKLEYISLTQRSLNNDFL